MTDDLAQWLRATLDAREREVRERHRQTCGHDEVGPDWPCNCDDHVSFSLAEVDAKRDIIDACESNAEDGSTSGAILAKTILPLLALPVADREGFREEWRA